MINSQDVLRWACASLLAPALLAGCALSGKTLDSEPAATVERMEVVQRKPAFGGASFDDIGGYERVVAVEEDVARAVDAALRERRPK